MLLSDKSRSLQYSLGFGGQGLSFARMEKARSVLPQGQRGRRWPCCQHLDLLGDTTMVTCHHSHECHPSGAASCGHLHPAPSPLLPVVPLAWLPCQPPGPSLPWPLRCCHLCQGQIRRIPLCPQWCDPKPSSPHTGGATGGTGHLCRCTYLRGQVGAAVPTLPSPCDTPGSRGCAAGASGGLAWEPRWLCWQQALSSCAWTRCVDSEAPGEARPAELGACRGHQWSWRPSWDGQCRGCHVPTLVWDHPECRAPALPMPGTAVALLRTARLWLDGTPWGAESLPASAVQLQAVPGGSGCPCP